MPIPDEMLEGITEVTQDLVPTRDQEEPIASYPDWRKEDTQVITYRLGNDAYPGIYAENRDEALSLCKAVYGRVLEANYVPGRAFLRVFKVKELP
jgi:hypothetical protein